MLKIRLFLVTIVFVVAGCAVGTDDLSDKSVDAGKAGAAQVVAEKPVPEPISPELKPEADPVKKSITSHGTSVADASASPENGGASIKDTSGSRKKSARKVKQSKTASKKKAAPRKKNGSALLGNTSGSIVSKSSSGKSDSPGYSGLSGAMGSIAGSINSNDAYTFYGHSGSSNYSVSPNANDSSIIVTTPETTIAIGDLNLSPPVNEDSTAGTDTTYKPAPAKQPDPAGVKRNNLQSYSVIVAADREITIPGPPGEMRVWIGSEAAEPEFDTDRKSVGQKDIPALSDTAKVTPYTPGFEVEPKESICEKIVPSGSEVRFQLKPSDTGTFTIGADVALYPSEDCSGTPIPKTAASVQVNVVVNKLKIIERGRDDIVAETWKGILSFWKEFIALVSALILFLIRKKLYKLFGFKPGKET